MDIKHLPPDPTRTAPAAPVSPVRDDGHGGRPDPEGPGGEDRVEISEHGRTLASEIGEVGSDGVPVGTLPAEKLTEIRRAIQARVHDSPDIIASVASRLVQRGDI